MNVSPRKQVMQLVRACVGLVMAAGTLAAQQRDTTRLAPRDTTRLAPRDTTRPPVAQDTVRRPVARLVDPFAPPITPRRAFLYSLAVPGLGQSRLQRPSAGAIYVAVEAISVAMLAKSRYDLNIAKRRVRESLVKNFASGPEGATFKDGKPVVQDTVVSRYAQPTNDELRSRLKARRLHYEDWVALLAFTHLFSGADAFVSAHLWDLPRQVEMRTLPSGATGVGFRVPFQPR
ncbi:MAG: hypothetical protein JNJ98_05020 [Gemmatimonadetes bacterium]|nr:hypothetical protein [Gemmatimonadota bacterium]